MQCGPDHGKGLNNGKRMSFFSKDTKTAVEAQSVAQFIAFGPVVFQVARVLRNTGILSFIEEAGSGGRTMQETIQFSGISPYGVRVLLESGLGIGLVIQQEGRFILTRTGHFVDQDALTRVNMDFIHDVCYKGLFALDKSIEQGKPEGLKEFGDWETIYEGLSGLPDKVQESWFKFDHFFSDIAFPAVMPLVYKKGIKKLLDIGGNTGKWAMGSAQYDPTVHITIMDLPGQLSMARKKVNDLGLSDRISFIAGNILDEHTEFPGDQDAIWMSQFLDCFSEVQIVRILRRCHRAMGREARLLILEAFWDLQRFETAAFCLQQTSIYFTALANGNSQLYHSEVFLNCLREAGFEVEEQVNHIGLSHTLLKCRKKL
jgi:ubiquinone/menaquinone biosynthesis C-methylase UbiE